ncbi:response regulator [Gracilibacillus marinus]|uniref:Response regulator n=1 Tax=Gracilibacillus marinus TaxID=630535 RepID=A0ABV8VX62_9BACI
MLKVFLVDDDIFVRKGIQTLINWKEYGFEVCGEADNGEDALEQIHQLKPDLVLTDIRMPVLDGLELIERVISEMNQAPSFIVISGYNDFKYAQKALRFGVEDFLLKPVDQDEIHATLERVSETIVQRNEKNVSKNELSTETIIKSLLADDIEMSKIKNMEHPILHANKYTFVKIEANGMYLDYPTMEQVMDEILTQGERDYITFYENGIGCYCVVITDLFLSKNEYTLERYFMEVDKEFNKQLDSPICIYIGKTVSTLLELKHSYSTAKDLIQYKYISNEGSVIDYNITNKQAYYIDIEKMEYDQMMEYVEENNKKAIKKQVHSMLQSAVNKNLAKDAIRTIVNRLNHEVLKQIKDANKYDPTMDHFKQMIEWDQYPLTLDQIVELWSSFLLECASLLKEWNHTQMKGTIHQIKKFIHSNYNQPITMKSIANEFYMNPVYMGQLFKKTYGVYFKDYILNVRITEAKKLLRTTDFRVYEVAQKVGFNNPDYFVTQFEKTVGTTPSQYRKQLLNQIG